jgi:hypothetical protein
VPRGRKPRLRVRRWLICSSVQNEENILMTGTEEGAVVAASYLLLRKAIGIIGPLLPIVCLVGDAAFTSARLPNSLSYYYYTPMRNYFVGSLCVLGVFLLLHEVGVRTDRWITNIAGASMLGVAFCPAAPPVPRVTTTEAVVGNLHLAFSVIAFAALGVMTWRFGQAGSNGPGSPAPPRGATVFYRVSAGLLLGFAFISGLANLLPGSVQNATLAIFDFEALAIVTFGVSWFVKGIDVESAVRASAALIRGLGLGARDPAAPGEIPP